MKIQVLQKHIDEGARLDSSSCPVARAVYSALEKAHKNDDGALEVDVIPSSRPYVSCGQLQSRPGYIQIKNPKPSIIKMSAAVDNFVKAFDAGFRVCPFDFEIPDGVLL